MRTWPRGGPRSTSGPATKRERWKSSAPLFRPGSPTRRSRPGPCPLLRLPSGARIARRFLALGRPAQAWAVAVPGGNFGRVSEVPLSHGERTEMALRVDKLSSLVKAFGADKAFRNEAPEVIARLAKTEQLDELQKQLVIQIFLEG